MVDGPESLPGDLEERARALLARWLETDDVDALDELLRGEVDLLARRLRARADRSARR
jgi:hypothetical protein